MRRKLERGIATLLITSVLLSIALVVTLGSYKTLFYQIKRAQNEVKSRQDHWLAEGGLECIYTKAVQDGVIPTASSIPECNIGSNTIVFTYEALAAMNNPTKVSSKVGYAGLSKNIVGSSSTSGYGAIKSTSNLYFNGSNSINPDPSKKSETENEWECRVATFKGTLKIFGNLTNKGLVDTVKPSNDFPSGQRCQSGFQSTLISSPTTENKDFVQDSKLDPFKDYFNTKRESWFEVMKNKKFTKISSTSLTDSNGNIKYSQDELPPPARVENCGKKISDQIANGHDLLWVYGSCHLSDSELATLGENVNAKTPTGVVIVSHNGLFTTKGALRFKGLIYHFVSGKEVTDPSTGEKNYQADFSPTESDWESRDSDTITELNTLKSDLTGDMAHHSLSLSDIVYYQRGAFHPSGGYVMDAYGKAALFNAALNLHFDSDAVSTPLSKINGKLKWQEGSWNAN